jgi:predicted Zn-dependent protease
LNLLHQRFEAHAIHPDHGNDVIPGGVRLAGHSLRFESEQAVWEIAVDRLHAEVRPGDEERIVLSDLGQPGLEIFTEDLSLLECRITPALIRAREQLSVRLSRQEWNRRLKLVGYTLGICILAIWLGGVLMGAMVRAIASRVPPEWDAKQGASLLAELQAEQTFLDDSNAVARLAHLAEPLLRVLPPSPNGYQFHIVEDETPNACALPGGHIVVHTGLLKLADRPEQVVAVLAHEVAHVTEKHMHRKLISTAGPLMICRVFLGGGGGALSLIGAGTALVTAAGFSQEYETEADDAGWRYLVAANIDPRGMAEMFRKMKQTESASGDIQMPQALSTHPALDKRIRRLEAKWAKLRSKAGFLTLDAEWR